MCRAVADEANEHPGALIVARRVRRHAAVESALLDNRSTRWHRRGRGGQLAPTVRARARRVADWHLSMIETRAIRTAHEARGYTRSGVEGRRGNTRLLGQARSAECATSAVLTPGHPGLPPLPYSAHGVEVRRSGRPPEVRSSHPTHRRVHEQRASASPPRRRTIARRHRADLPGARTLTRREGVPAL